MDYFPPSKVPLIRFFSLLFVSFFLFSCQKDSTPFGIKKDLQNTPVLTQSMLDLSHLTEFIAFGADLGGGKINPAWEFRASPAMLPVFACAPGVVRRVRQNPAPQTDFEIAIQPHEGSLYTIYYDHVKNVTVQAGDTVQAGTQLGTLGDWTPTEGRVEIQINVGTTGHEARSVCPLLLGNADFNAAHENAFAAHGTGGSSPCLQDQVQP